MAYRRAPSDEAWAAQRVEGMPPRWRRRVLGAWQRKRADFDAEKDWRSEERARRAANLQLLETTTDLGAVRVPLDATDRDICERAERLAEDCASLATVYHQAEALRAAMARKADANSIAAPAGKHISDEGAIARMADALWWRRQLRKLHAKSVEGAAIKLGYVNKTRDCYVSNESLQRRQQQNQRNAEALEATTARNELGQEFTLAELAAKGPANKAIRRAELMTRIGGFERIARALGHDGLFFTITCPSRMHRWRTVGGGRVIANQRYDGTKPNEAQQYLAKVWARIRAALKRAGLGIYGFRIAEPNHDGTPHWHLLVFHAAGELDRLRAVVLRYALADSPDEPGARRHRVDFKPIDWEKGTAAGYIAKYVAKNIDGYKVEKDLFGNDALSTAARVEAWAATWGIRQFQQVGGPPVGVWRELRRIEELPADAPDHLAAAHRAVNKTAVIEGRENATVAWDHYCKAQGGVFCGRDYRIRIATEEVQGVGRYGDPLGARHVGVSTFGEVTYRDGIVAERTRKVLCMVRSVRHAWEIVARKRPHAREFKGAQRPWTRVNNCTEGGQHGSETERRVGDGPRGASEVESGAAPHQGIGGYLCGPAPGINDRHGGQDGHAGATH